MKFEAFFEKFELFADAPDAVAKMRELVLEFAVRGELVSQDPEDEPATALLQHLIEFKQANPLSGRRGRSGKRPTETVASSIDIPANWTPTTIGEILHVIRGASPRPKGDPQYFSETRTSFHWVKISDIRKHGQNGILMDTDEFLTEAGMRKSVLLQKGTLVLTNSATIGVPIVLGIEGCCIHDGFLAFPNFPHGLLSQRFLLYQLLTLKKHAEGSARGLAQLNLNTGLVRLFPVGLPPLAEQKRIVAKVDELMALCDRLEAQQQERKTRHAAVARASLARFADVPTPANIQFLFHPSYTISPADLRKSILTLAVQGRLVPQDPNDEPAVGMLKNIETEKKRMRALDELKADKKAWINSLPRPPRDIPKSWRWVRVQDIFEISRGGSPRPAGDPRFFGGSIPWVTVREITKDSGKYLTATVKGLTEAGSKRSRFINPDDLLLTNSGATLGVPKISKLRGCINDGVAVLRLFHSFELNDFGYLYLTQQTTAFRSVKQGMGQPNLNTPIIASWFFPLPPLAEQRRIVAKVDHLMALVDQLETQLTTASKTGKDLLEALVAELTAPPT